MPDPIKTASDLSRVRVPLVEDELSYVFDAIRMIKQELNALKREMAVHEDSVHNNHFHE